MNMQKLTPAIVAVAVAGIAFTAMAGAIPTVDATLTPDVSTTGFDQMIKNTVNWILGLLGFVAVIVIIIAGIQTVIHSDNEEEAKKSLSTLKWAIIGLVIVTASYAIVNFLLGFFLTQ